MMLENPLYELGDEEDSPLVAEDLSDTEADITEFAKSANGDGDLSDTEADVAEVQEGDQSG